MTMNTEQLRAEFEVWANGRCELHLVNPAGRYSSAITQFAWEAWQAARRAQVVPQFSPVAQTKLKYLLEAGEAITGYAIEKDGRRGAIDCHGFVYWWNDAAPCYPATAGTQGAAQPMPAAIKATIKEALIFRHDAGEDQDACDEALNWLSQNAAPQPPESEKQACWCETCRPQTLADMRFIVCPDCGNKRCPKAKSHENACTNSNAPGQKGSSWEHVKPAT